MIFVDNNKKYYNENAKWWAENKTHSFWQEKQFREFNNYLKSGAKVLDIGSAWGIHVPLFLGIGRHLKYEGMDLSKGMVYIAKKRFPQLDFRVADILDGKHLPKKKYDAFWASAVLMHIPEIKWDEMMLNIESIVKPGAVGYLTLPRRRPHKHSPSDRRFFSLWTLEKAKKFFGRRKWKILKNGKMPQRHADWFWIIVKLP